MKQWKTPRQNRYLYTMQKKAILATEKMGIRKRSELTKHLYLRGFLNQDGPNNANPSRFVVAPPMAAVISKSKNRFPEHGISHPKTLNPTS